MIASVVKSLEKPFIQGSVILNWLVDTRSEIEELLGPVQTSNFTCAESNANELKQ